MAGRGAKWAKGILWGGLLAGASGAQAQDLDPLLVRLTDVAAGTGRLSTPVGTPVGFSYLYESASLPHTLAVESGRCYSVVAVGEASIEDLDLHVYGAGTGVEIASDTDTDPVASVHFCSHDAAEVTLDVRAYRGSGRAALQVFEDRTLGVPATTELADTLNAALDASWVEVAQGYVPAAPSYLTELATGASESREVLLAGGRCYVMLAAAVATVVDLDLALVSAVDGALIDTDVAADARPVIRPCIPDGEGGLYRLDVTMVVGYGEVIVGFLGTETRPPEQQP